MTRGDGHSGSQDHLDAEGNCQCVGGCCVDWLHRGLDPKDKLCICPGCGGNCQNMPDGRTGYFRRVCRNRRMAL